MSKGYKSQLKEPPLAKAGTILAPKVVLDNNTKYEIYKI